MKVSPIHRRTRFTAVLAAAGLTAITTIAWATMATAADTSCQPGSGPNLAGRHFTNGTFAGFQSGQLRCANLTGADLAGLSLIQIDFTGAILRNANLEHADLTQATLNTADLSGANLTDANLTQVEAHQTKFVGANLSGADLTQADLTGANLSKTKLSGASFNEATLDQTTFTGATGVPPWDLWIGIAAVLFLALLLWRTLRRGVRAVAKARTIGFSNVTGSNPTVALLRGIIGSVLVALGFNLCVGGFVGEILSAAGPPVSQTCTGLVCTVGVSSGFIGIFGGVVLMVVGFIVRASRSNDQPVITTAGSAAGPFGPGPGFS